MLLAAALFSARLLAPGDSLPDLRGDYLTGRAAAMPADARGKVALLALGFTYQSRFAVEAWVKRFRAAFGSEPGTAFYEVPMLGGGARLGRWFIDSGMRSGTPKEDHERVITVYGGTGQWKDRLGYAEKGPEQNDAYLILIDRTGIIRWIAHGPMEEARWAELEAAARRAMAGPEGA
jgi:hypothetical protein